MNISDIQDNTIIICENNYKKYILNKFSENKSFLNVKFFTKKEFLDNYLFKYDEQAVLYLVDTYGYKVDIANMYLDNIYYVDETKKYKTSKLNKLVEIKNELLEKGLLEFNNNFKEYIKEFNILVWGYSYIDNLFKNIINKLNAKIICDKEIYNIDKVYEFETMEDEINFVCKKICELITNGVSINKIKLAGITEDYFNDLERIFRFYNIPIKINNGESLYTNEIVQKFLSNYDNDLTKTIEIIKNEDSNVVKKIINICNKYSFEDNKNKVKELIINDLKNVKTDNFKLKNYIEIVDINSPFDDEYVFLMSFNTGNIPVSVKDENYITDNIKEEINLELTNEINKKCKKYIINKLRTIKNLIVTYKKKSSKQEFYPSSLINVMKLKIVCEENNFYESYSVINDKIKLAKIKDDFNKYGNLDKNYNIYENSLGDISYNTFDNKFKEIDKSSLNEYLKGKLTLSYTSLNNFNKCAFRYYISNILKLDKYEETFETFIGSIFHDVLEKCFNNNLDVTLEVNNYIKSKNKILTLKERFFINKIILDIKFAIEVLNKQKEYISFDKVLYEKNIIINKNKDMIVEFTGFIDKILYKEEDNNTLVSIIDYKTGFIDIDLKYVPYGLNLQLPIYLYLVKKSNIFINPKFVGFYLQYILDKDIIRDITKNYDEERYNNLKLMGYSNSDIHSLVVFDNNYNDSNLIKGMKTKVDGDFSSYSKVLNDDEINNLIDLTEKNIDESIDKIINGKFDINPKKIGFDKDYGCMYCKFKDICFKKENDYEILEDIKTLDFLRGDENA